MPGHPLLILIISLAVLILGGRYLIRLLEHVTRALGISEYAAAFFFLAIGTSLPELFVAISSSLQGSADLVIATGLGSNVINMSLILGLAAIISLGISTSGLRLRRDLLFGGLTTCLPILFLLNGVISRLEGAILLLAFVGYAVKVYRQRPTRRAAVAPHSLGRGLASAAGILILLGVILLAAHSTVESSVQLAKLIHLSPFLIGIFLLALGTSLPELGTTLQAAFLRKPTMAFGNILGSNIADSALIIGVASVIRPLETELTVPMYMTAVFVVGLLILLGFFAATRQRISISEGLLLLGCFFLFGFSLFLVGPPLAGTY